MPDFSYEKLYWEKGEIVAGIDEAGRGALAGPVVAAAAILDENFVDFGINDSKALSAEKRQKFFSKIKDDSIIFAIGEIDNLEIDSANILKATMRAMNIAIETLAIKPNRLIIDGNYFSGSFIPHKTIVKGDSKSLTIALASIIAKVARDNWMEETADKLYPEYGFAKHKGYGTKAHLEAIEKYGPSPIHRKSFLKKYINQQNYELLF